jgi:hypothetical protein
MFPSFEMYHEVKLSQVSIMERDLYKVSWIEPRSGEPDAFLCYLNPGEGTKVIRSILYEQTARCSDLICQSGSHGYKAEMVWKEDVEINLKGNKSAQLWSVYTSSLCLMCRAAYSDADSDLIPERIRS